MSNAYGFDFLRTEHLDESAKQDVITTGDDDRLMEPGSPVAALSEEALLQIQNKPDLEKQYDILAFLQAHRGSGFLSSAVIYKSTGIDLDINPRVVGMLQLNPKVKLEMVPDPENPALMVATYAYQAKYSNVRDRTTLLAQINQLESGVPMRDLLDSYPTVADDLQGLVTAGDILAIPNSEDKDKILFPRGEAFLVELDGMAVAPKSTTDNGQSRQNGTSSQNGADEEVFLIETDVDPLSQIRRGEAVQVGGEWFRVSSAVKAGVPLSDQPARAQAPLSVVSLQDLSKRNEVDGYIRPLTAKCVPLDGSLSSRGVQNLHNAKRARERLQKISHGHHGGGRTGVLGQLLGSHAHASNPATLAAAVASSSSASSHQRKRLRLSSAAAAGGGAGSAAAAAKAAGDNLIKAASDTALAMYSHARRHGCTKDIREMYLATSSLVPESDADLHALLLEHKLLEPNEQMRRPRLKKSGTNVDEGGKPKKRRYYERKNQRMTNTHLDGTSEGAVIALALEQHKQGKAVGDGGM